MTAHSISESDMIRIISRCFPRHPDQVNAPFTCDAEIIRCGDEVLALTMDEFSPDEDRFTAEDPERLGANLAVATLSDVLAAGAEPAWFMQAVTLPRGCDALFFADLMNGIGQVLAEAGCALCGGDIGTADTWRFCGFAMGRVPEGRPLTHCLPQFPQTLWVTGQLGDANIAALLNAPTPRFEYRQQAAARIRDFATACIDTSSGFFDALWLLWDMSDGIALQVDLDRLPLASAVPLHCDALRIPTEATLLGGAGEYELLFATPDDLDAAAYAALLAVGATPIGAAHPAPASAISLRRHGQSVGFMRQPPPCPRRHASIEDYIRAVVRMAEAISQ